MERRFLHLLVFVSKVAITEVRQQRVFGQLRTQRRVEGGGWSSTRSRGLLNGFRGGGALSQRLGSGKPLILLLYREASDRKAVKYVLHISCVIICHAKPVRAEMGGRWPGRAYPDDSG